TLDEALDAFAANIDEDVFVTQRDLVISQELYTLAARRPEFRDITSGWMARTRATLAPFVDADTAVMLDALNEGLALHRALHIDPSAAALIRGALGRLARPD
ncbi:MAG: TetR family transcriptional regulator, partial [Brachybacterium tyrofermentans]